MTNPTTQRTQTGPETGEAIDGVYPFRAPRDSGQRLPFTPEKRAAWIEAALADESGFPMPPCGHESCKGSWWPDEAWIEDDEVSAPRSLSLMSLG